MDAEVVAKLLTRPFTPFDLVLVSRDEYHVDDPDHCRLSGDRSVFVWSPSGDVEVIDLRLVERIRINDTLGFNDFEKLLEKI